MRDFFDKTENNDSGKAFFSNEGRGGNPFFQKKEADEMDNQSCSGWESDPQSFCIVVGKKFLLDQFSISAAAERVEVMDDGGCHVFFESGIVLSVQRLPGQEVVVYVTPSTTNKKVGSKFCYYSYTCNVNGKLELTQNRCSGKDKP